MSNPVARHATDPLGFVLSLLIYIGGRVVQFGTVAAPHQIAILTALAPVLLAVAKGERPVPAAAFLCWSKGAGKDSILAKMLFK